MTDRYHRFHASPLALAGLLLCVGGSTALSLYETRPWAREHRLTAALQGRLAERPVPLDAPHAALHPAVAPFYADRQWALAWTDAARDTLLFLLRDAAADGLDPAEFAPDAHAALGRAALAKGRRGDSLLVERDLRFSDLFVRLGERLHAPQVGPDSLYRRSQWRPVSRPAPDLEAALRQAFGAPVPAEGVAEALDALRPQHPGYRALRAAYAQRLSDPDADDRDLLRLNLERWRWLPDSLGDFHVLVNIPAYELTVHERDRDGWREALRMRAVVGKQGWSTTVMTDTMDQVVFNPTWTIPASIQREQYGAYRGRVVRRPGPGNPLGRVKFLFPNEYAIYIHDTPTRWPFGREARAYSHGCVRAHHPDSLAMAVLGHANGWAPEEVDAIWRGPWRLRSVALEKPVPVHLVYFTAWADADGTVTRYPDVYGRDAPLAAALGLGDA
ncbi:MAG: L,D-transpeptidase family protein [Rubricoccaceae bacterium]|nr:L,D-transpeptidase family protein [Rubricoccaceae bacterium]